MFNQIYIALILIGPFALHFALRQFLWTNPRDPNPSLPLTLVPILVLGIFVGAKYGLEFPSGGSLTHVLHGLAIFWALAALGSLDFRLTLSRVLGSWVWILLATYVETRGEHLTQLVYGYAASGFLFVISTHILDVMESNLNQSLILGEICGVGKIYPKSSAMLRACILFLGCIPGSVMFSIEDVLVEHSLRHSNLSAFLVLTTVLLSSIAGYRGFVSIFYGNPAKHLSKYTADSSLPYLRWVMASTIGCGLFAWFYL